MKPLEIYVHIPFCVKKCNYCDFLSAPSTLSERRDYVKSLCQKIRACADRTKAYSVTSIFIGGGTPSLLEIDLMEAVFQAIYETFSVDENAEITLEMNPGTAAQEKLTSYRNLGINRLSIGLQSADKEELKTLGRIHTYEDFLATYRMAVDTGFTNLNVDLMSGIPGQTLKSWHQTLTSVAGLGPAHISAYSLIIEEGTPFYAWYGPEAEPGAAPALPGEDTERQMYYDTREILAGYGYHRYEISNYAKEGYECRHNLGYWERAEYLGFGTGAASLVNNRRWIEGEEPESLSKREQQSEFMFLGLRKMQGVSEAAFFKAFDEPLMDVYGEKIRDLTEKGLLCEKNGYVYLTDRGIDISNYVMSEFV